MKEGQDSDLKEDGEMDDAKDQSQPLEIVLQGKQQPRRNADPSAGMHYEAYEKLDENRIVILSNAVVYEGAVVVEFLNAPLAALAVVAR